MTDPTRTKPSGDVADGLVILFFLIAFGLAWSLFVLFIFAADWVVATFGDISSHNPLFILAVYAPAIAALSLVGLKTGFGGMGRILSRLGAPADLKIWLMMETPRAVLNAGSIAEAVEEDAGRRLDALVIGTNDLAKETRAQIVPGRVTMLPWIATFVAAARANDLSIIDGVYGEMDDASGLAEECRQGRDLGMDGKTLIHPKQIEVANKLFAPSAAEVAWARRIIEAFEQPQNAGRGAIALDGRMVERLHAEIAEKTVALADAIALRGAA